MDLKKLGVRALVTFLQVFLSVVIGTGVLDVSASTANTALMSALDVSASTANTALMSALGAGLSVVYNAATQWLQANQA